MRRRTGRLLITTFVFILKLLAQWVPTYCLELQDGYLAAIRTERDIQEINPLGKEFVDCSWHNIAILCDPYEDYDDTLIDFVSLVKTLMIPYSVYRVEDGQWVHIVFDQYVAQHVENFVIITTKTHEFVSQMNDLFNNYSTNVLAAFPHRSTWLLLTNSSNVSDYNNSLSTHSLLDNVASVHFIGNTTCEMKTLMWGKERSRYWDTIDKRSLGSSECAIYPNKRLGLNGRSVSWLAIKFTYGVSVDTDSHGNPQYVGLFVDLANVLGEMLNSTTVLLPPAAEPITSGADEYSELLHNTSTDFGLVYFSQDVTISKGMKGVYPIFLDATVAAYIYKPSPKNHLKVGHNGGYYSYPIQLLVVVTFIYAVLFYKLISFMTSFLTEGKSQQHSKGTSRHLSPSSSKKYDLSPSYPSLYHLEEKFSYYSFKFDQIHYKESNTDVDNRKHSLRNEYLSKGKRNVNNSLMGTIFRSLLYMYETTPNFQVIEFLGSHLSQSIIMRPSLFSLRVFIFFWCFYVLQITCIFTGSLTANFAIPFTPPPFSTVAEVLQSSETICGTFEQTELINRSKEWNITGQNWEGHLRQFPVSVSTSAKDFKAFMEQPSSKLKVFVYYENLVRALKHESNFSDLYITMDNFQPGMLGFVAPNNSGLVDVVSEAVIKLHESGHMEKMCKPYLGERPKKMKKENKPVRMKVTVLVLKDLFITIGILLAVAAIALMVELFIHYTNATK